MPSRYMLAAMALVTVSASASDQNAEALRFAKTHQGKFATEIPSLPRSFTLKYSPGTELGDQIRYDPQLGQATIIFLLPLSTVVITDNCTNSGQFAGQNAFGAKTIVQRKNCDQLIVVDTQAPGFVIDERGCSDNCPDIGGGFLTAKMTPSQYRALKARGPVLYLDFGVGEGVSQEIIDRRNNVEVATIATRAERRNSEYTMYGRIRSVTVFGPNGLKLGQFSRRQ